MLGLRARNRRLKSDPPEIVRLLSLSLVLCIPDSTKPRASATYRGTEKDCGGWCSTASGSDRDKDSTFQSGCLCRFSVIAQLAPLTIARDDRPVQYRER
jgi:hypothetical protein